MSGRIGERKDAVARLLEGLRYRAEHAAQDAQDSDSSPQARSYLRGIRAAATELAGRIEALERQPILSCYTREERLEALADEYERRGDLLLGTLRNSSECDLDRYYRHGQYGRVSVYDTAIQAMQTAVSLLVGERHAREMKQEMK